MPSGHGKDARWPPEYPNQRNIFIRLANDRVGGFFFIGKEAASTPPGMNKDARWPPKVRLADQGLKAADKVPKV